MPEILHICKMTGVAGTENHLLALLPGLRARGLGVSLIVLAEPGNPMDDYTAQMQARGVDAESMLIQRDVEPALIGRLAARIGSGAFDAVHTHLIHADWHGIPAARRAGVRHIFTSGHNDDPFRRRLPIRLIQAYLWRRVSAGIAISEAVRQFMIRVEFAPPRKVHTVHYGFDPADGASDVREQFRRELGLSADAQVIGSVCRLIEQKGLPYALTAFARLAHAFPQAHYVIIGDGPLHDALQAQVRDLDLVGRVHFPGWRSNAAALMPAFDLFLMPSLWEGFGLVVLEAMAARLPVIASHISALPEIVEHGKTGYLAAPADVEALRVHLVRLLSDTAHARALGAAGRARLESEFSVAKMVERTMQVYDGVGFGRAAPRVW